MMILAPLPINERERLAALRASHLLDTPPDPALDEVVRLASGLFGVSTAVVNLLDADRAWAKAAVGKQRQGSVLAREAVFCSWTILAPHALTVISDVASDPRFAGSPLLEMGLRFYAGSPLLSPDGLAVGTLCVMGEHPQDPSSQQLQALRVLASAAEAHMDLHRRTLLAERASAELAAVLEQAPDAFISMGADGRVLDWNAQAEHMFGWRREEAVGTALVQLIVPVDLRDAYRAALAHYLQTGEAKVLDRGAVELSALRRDGAPLPVELTLASVCWDGEEHFNAFVRDISARKAVEAERNAEMLGLRLLSGVQGRLARGVDLVEVWPEICAAAVEICAADGAQLWQASSDGGLRAEAAIGLDVTGERIPPGAPSLIGESISRARPIFVADLANHPLTNPGLLERSGARSVFVCPMQSAGRVLAALCVFWKEARTGLSIREERMLELLSGESAVALERSGMLAELRELSNTDPLTGAANRRRLTVELECALKDARHLGDPLCVAILDLDHFKRFNDDRGHLAGDRLLTDSVAAWQRLVRAGDTIARYGGEEFALVLPDCEIADATVLIESLRSAIPLGQHCSAGLAVRVDGESATHLLGRADRALYRAKQEGRDTTRIDEPIEMSTPR